MRRRGDRVVFDGHREGVNGEIEFPDGQARVGNASKDTPIGAPDDSSCPGLGSLRSAPGRYAGPCGLRQQPGQRVRLGRSDHPEPAIGRLPLRGRRSAPAARNSAVQSRLLPPAHCRVLPARSRSRRWRPVRLPSLRRSGACARRRSRLRSRGAAPRCGNGGGVRSPVRRRRFRGAPDPHRVRRLGSGPLRRVRHLLPRRRPGRPPRRLVVVEA